MRKKQVFLSKNFHIYKYMKRNSNQKFIKNIILLVISQILIKIFGFIYKIYLTNKNGFGDMGNAIYSAAYQIYALFLTISSIGIPNAIASLISTKLSQGNVKGAHRTFKVAFSIFGTIGFILAMTLYLLSSKIANSYLNMPETEQVLKILAPSIFIVSIEAVMKGFFNGREQISNTANSQSLEQIVKALTTLIMVEIVGNLSNNNTILMVQAASTSTFFSNIISIIYLIKKYILARPTIGTEIISSKIYKRERLKEIIKGILVIAMPISLSAILSMTNKTIDTFTIIRIGSKIIGEEKIKIQYGILSGKIETLISIPYAFNIAFATTLIPTIASLKAQNNLKLAKKRIEFSIIATILIGLPISVLMSILAEPILMVIFPNAHQGSELLKISAWNIIIVLLMQTVNGALQGLGKVKIPVIALLIGCILKFILNIMLIPIEKLGIKGAVISTIISQSITLIICMTSLKKELNTRKIYIKPIIATTIMSIIVYIAYTNMKITNNILKLTIPIIIGGICYIILLFILKIISKEEIKIIPYRDNVYQGFQKHKKIKTTIKIL